MTKVARRTETRLSGMLPRWLYRHLRPADVLSFVAGLCFPMGFSPYNLYVLPTLCLALLFAVWADCSSWRAAWRGWLFGLGVFGAGVWWVQESFQYSQLTGPLAWVLAACFIAFLALFPALAGFVARRWVASTGPLSVLAISPAAWLLAEWLRGEGVSGFAWLQVGYALVDSPFTALFPLFGAYGAGLVCALLAGSLAGIVRGGRDGFTIPLAVLGALALALLAAALVREFAWTTAEGRGLDVALVQGNVAQADKWKATMREPTLERYRTLTEANLSADLIVWPETAVPGLLHVMKPFLHEIAALAGRADTHVMTGIPVADPATGKYYNSVVLMGDEPGFYRKRHLVPFGEYLPFDRILRPVTRALGIPIARFSAGGADQVLLEVDGRPVGLFICYEVSFGAEVRSALPEAQLLVTLSNDAWFGSSFGPHQHLQIARARALETGRWLVRSTNTGLTVIVDTLGEVVAAAPQFEVAVARGRAEWRTGITPFVRLGNWPALLVSLGLLGFGAWRWRRSGARFA